MSHRSLTCVRSWRTNVAWFVTLRNRWMVPGSINIFFPSRVNHRTMGSPWASADLMATYICSYVFSGLRITTNCRRRKFGNCVSRSEQLHSALLVRELESRMLASCGRGSVPGRFAILKGSLRSWRTRPKLTGWRGRPMRHAATKPDQTYFATRRCRYTAAALRRPPGFDCRVTGV